MVSSSGQNGPKTTKNSNRPAAPSILDPGQALFSYYLRFKPEIGLIDWESNFWDLSDFFFGFLSFSDKGQEVYGVLFIKISYS